MSAYLCCPTCICTNIAFLVSMDNHTVLHLGDTDWVLAEPVFKKEKLTEQSIDIAILPYWMLLGKYLKEKVESLLAPKEIIVAPKTDILVRKQRLQ